MTQQAEAGQVAEFLSMLKRRTERSYAALAGRVGVSSSSLHRYCTGEKLPENYALVRRFAHTCGATPQELRELRDLWLRAYAVKNGCVPGGQLGLPSQVAAAGPALPVPSLAERRRRRGAAATGALLATLTVIWTGWMTVSAPARPNTAEAGSGSPAQPRLLFAAPCRPVVGMGDRNECVREVQTLLSRAGATGGVDGAFGPRTQELVTAFQALAGLQTTGVVDDPTKRSLYAGRTDLRTWSPELVVRRIREVFPEEPDRAVGIARCQSMLDPLRIEPTGDGTRSWGVFRLSDARLRELGGSARLALDAEWNIAAARRLSGGHLDVRYWPDCVHRLGGGPKGMSDPR